MYGHDLFDDREAQPYAVSAFAGAIFLPKAIEDRIECGGLDTSSGIRHDDFGV